MQLKTAMACLWYKTIKDKQETTKLLRVMKLTAIILLSACMAASAAGTAQGITLKLKNAPLERVFAEIKKQTGYSFVYNNNLVATAKKVDLQVSSASIEVVLDKCFKDQPLSYKIIDRTVIVIARSEERATKQAPTNVNDLSQPPPIDIKGRVVDENGKPVIASVQVKGTNKGTTTNDNGEFELKGVDDNATLVISGVSIESFEVKVSGRSELALEAKVKNVQGEEVVIKANTGYQEIAPNKTTGSFNVIDNKTLNQQVGTNILKRLEGMTTAVLFDTKPEQTQKKSNITVRGFSSINGPLDPLIVLDGFIYEGSINNINPNLVENITILKDAAAASIWGARAGNGVIVITTKKGSFNQKLKVDFNSTLIINSKPDLFYLPQMSSTDYIDVEQFLYNKGVYNSLFTSTSRPGITPAVEIFRKRTLGQISASDSATQIDALKNVDIRDQFNKYFYTNAVIQQYNINLRGGSNTNAYILSAGFDKSLNEVYDKNRRINIRMENVFRPMKKLEASLGIYYTNSQGESGRSSYGEVTVSNRPVPYLQFADENGNPIPVAKSLRRVYTDTAGIGKLLDWNYYPLEDYKHDKTTTNLNELYANIGIKYKLFSFLDLDVKYQYQHQNIEATQVQDLGSFGARDIINRFSQLNYSTGAVTYIVPKGGIKNQSDGSVESQTLRGQANFNHSWGLHNFSGIVGGEIRNAVRNGNSFTVYGYSADPATNGIVDYVTRYPSFINGGKQTIPGSAIFSPEANERFASVYTNLAYTFRNRYILSASARKDGSNVFGVNTNDKWKPLWSSGIGWNISREKFYALKFIPDLKARVTYGYSGNVDVSKSAVPVATYSKSNHSLTNLPTGVVYTINNPELRWEETRTLNFGIDFSFVNQILTGSLDYYTKEGRDLYGPTPYDYTTFGLDPTVVKNVANMKGKGLEISLSTKIFDKKTFNWNATALFTYQTHKTTKYNSPTASQISQILSSGTIITPILGKPLYAIAAYKWGGLDNAGNPQGYLNGQLSKDYNAIRNSATTKGEAGGSIVYVGSAIPTLFGSLINSFGWKNLTVSINILYKGGYYFRKSSLSYVSLINSGIGHKEYQDRWQKPGDETVTNVPSFVYPNDANRDAFYESSSVNVLKGDHLRLQYVNLAYTFAGRKKSKLPFDDLQLYANAANLGIIWRANDQNLDPDYYASIPPSKSWALGIRASF